MKSITILCFYFGKFSEWAPLYFETLKRNSTIKFIFYTDCDHSAFEAPNIVFNKISFEEYVQLACEKINIAFNPANTYKLCDLRPLLATIHFNDIKNSDFYGYADQDLFFGDIRSFYTDKILSKYDVFSTHEKLISDHFALFRNNEFNRNMFKEIGGWKEKLESPFCVGIGEEYLMRAYNNIINKKRFIQYKPIKWWHELTGAKFYFKEQFTTPFTKIPWIDGTIDSNQPDIWYYKNGIITNNRDGERSFMYIHFMNFKSSKYRHDGTKAPWEGHAKICFAKPDDMKSGIMINCNGIFTIK